MKTARVLCAGLAAILVGALVAACRTEMPAEGGTLRVGDDDIGGTVTSSNGPEAGV